jgi:hypothetical protein
MTETLTLQAHVDHDGKLIVQLPAALAGQEVEITITARRSRVLSDAEWHDALNRLYGALADSPIERGDQELLG